MLSSLCSFCHHTSTLSVILSSLGLEDGPPIFYPRFSCVDILICIIYISHTHIGQICILILYIIHTVITNNSLSSSSFATTMDVSVDFFTTVTKMFQFTVLLHSSHYLFRTLVSRSICSSHSLIKLIALLNAS
jgi:hypothetical protein